MDTNDLILNAQFLVFCDLAALNGGDHAKIQCHILNPDLSDEIIDHWQEVWTEELDK